MIINEIGRNIDIYLEVGFTDMRKSIDGLAAIVQQRFQLNPMSKALFLFCGKRSDRLKALYWEEDGFLLLYKRLENGKYQWPRNENEVRKISEQQLRWLLEGLMIDQTKVVQIVKDKRIVYTFKTFKIAFK